MSGFYLAMRMCFQRRNHRHTVRLFSKCNSLQLLTSAADVTKPCSCQFIFSVIYTRATADVMRIGARMERDVEVRW